MCEAVPRLGSKFIGRRKQNATTCNSQFNFQTTQPTAVRPAVGGDISVYGSTRGVPVVVLQVALRKRVRYLVIMGRALLPPLYCRTRITVRIDNYSTTKYMK